MLYFEELQKKHFETHSKNIRTLRISKPLFDKFLEYHMHKFSKVTSEEYKLLTHGLIDKWCEYFYEESNTGDNAEPYRIVCNVNTFRAIMTSLKLNKEPKELIKELTKLIEMTGGYHYDYILICSNDAENANAKAGLSTVIKAKTWIKKQIEKHFNHDSLEEFVKTHGDTSRVDPLRFRYNKTKTIEKWDDCTYMDIHKAHASELMKMFKDTGIDKAVANQVNKGIKFKKKGDLLGYKETKDIINYAVGMLGKVKRDINGKKLTHTPDTWLLNCNTQPLYNRIVNNIRNKIENQSNLMSCNNINATRVYAQTDGLIIQHSNPVTSSDKIGEFGLEFKGTVYTYHCENVDGVKSGYTIYQYTDNDGVKHVKGDLPDELKQYIDLEKGQVVVYKKRYDELHYIHNDLLEIKKENIHENN